MILSLVVIFVSVISVIGFIAGAMQACDEKYGWYPSSFPTFNEEGWEEMKGIWVDYWEYSTKTKDFRFFFRIIPCSFTACTLFLFYVSAAVGYKSYNWIY